MTLRQLAEKIASDLKFTIVNVQIDGKYPAIIFKDRYGERLEVRTNKAVTKLHKISNMYWFSEIRKVIKDDKPQSEGS